MGTLERAREQAKLIAAKTRIAYIYVLMDGETYYASEFPPAYINAKFVETVESY